MVLNSLLPHPCVTACHKIHHQQHILMDLVHGLKLNRDRVSYWTRKPWQQDRLLNWPLWTEFYINWERKVTVSQKEGTSPSHNNFGWKSDLQHGVIDDVSASHRAPPCPFQLVWTSPHIPLCPKPLTNDWGVWICKHSSFLPRGRNNFELLSPELLEGLSWLVFCGTWHCTLAWLLSCQVPLFHCLPDFLRILPL